jgi:hypothetical protein
MATQAVRTVETGLAISWLELAELAPARLSDSRCHILVLGLFSALARWLLR